MPATVFDRLCDLVAALGRIEHRMPHGAVQCDLAALIARFDALIDDTVAREERRVRMLAPLECEVPLTSAAADEETL